MYQQTETALMRTGFDEAEMLHDPRADADAPPNRVLSSLRGRHVWAILFGTLFAALGAAAGYTLWTPEYRSVGLIRVSPKLPRILYKSEDNSMMPMYDGFISSQIDLMQSQRVLDLAMEKPEWKELGRGLSDEAVKDFRDQLNVSRARGSQVIKVSFTDEDPRAVSRAVKSVIQAYKEIFVDGDRMTRDDRLRTLENLERRHRNDIKNQQQRMQAVSDNLDTKNLDLIYDSFDAKSLDLVYQANLAEGQRVQMMLKDIAVREAGLKAISQQQASSDAANAGATGTPGAAAAVASSIPRSSRTPIQIAADRSTMQSLIQQKAALALQLGQMRSHYSENHPRLKESQRRLDNLDQLLKPYEERYLELTGGTGSLTSSGPSPAMSAQQQLLSLEAQKKVLRSQLASVRTAVRGLVGKIADIDVMKLEVEDSRVDLKRTSDRLDELTVESSVGGRINVIGAPTSAGIATNLGKRKQLIVLGFMGGLTFGFGLVVLRGLADRRYRFVADAQESIATVPMIGVLPNLPKRLSDPEQAAIAAHSVQQIRMQLQLEASTKKTQVIAVTSPMPGDGKTSLAMSLGLSFAASRSRTLMIDFDLYGRGLTRQSECIVREKIGPILLQEGLLTAEQLADGLEWATRAKCRLGEALIEMNVLTRDDVQRALAMQSASTVGLHDVLDGKPLEACVHSTDTPLLSILPVGQSGPDLVASLSPASVAQLLEQARQQYNTIVIDTGPIPASTEASLVAAQVDGVILTIRKGVQQQAAERAVLHLRTVGARISGVVFNGAKVSDMEHSGFSSGASSRMSGGQLPHRRDRVEPGSMPDRFGPVARAAALALPSVDAGQGRSNGQDDNGAPKTPR
jgi:Mrp family chromosome partitioning ATPase/uncharacterized protein involved in exopolysaccharide biosynthesis